MVIKINTKKISQLEPDERDYLKQSLTFLNKLTPKLFGGIVEIFKEQNPNNQITFKELYRKIVGFECQLQMDEDFGESRELSHIDNHNIHHNSRRVMV